MKIYLVGGAVRDELLGLPVQDRDYVVVGASIEQMLAAGYTAVGADFPVFLHPQTHEEYALARTERKTAPGYKGFVFHTATNVTLEQDLHRRDLTINAMARDQHGHLLDPYSGEADLHHKLLRHVSDAFSEDPVRILRVARFAARFAALGFTVAEETMALMRSMVSNGEIDHLVPERVWQELARGLMEATPSRMFEVLRECGALQRLLPEVDKLFGVPQSIKSHPEVDTGRHVMMVLQAAAQQQAALPIRFAALTHDLGKGVTPTQYLPHHPHHEIQSVTLVNQLCERLRVPGDCHDLGVMAARWHGEVHAALSLDAAGLLALLDGTDALRRPERFTQLLDTCRCDHQGRLGFADAPYLQHGYLQAALSQLQSLDQGAVAKSVQPQLIAEAMRLAKLNLLQRFVDKSRTTNPDKRTRIDEPRKPL